MITKIYKKIVKLTIKGNNSLNWSTDHFDHVDMFVDLTLLNIIDVYSLTLSIIIFKIITKRQNFLKITNSGTATQQPVVRFI